MGANDRVAAPPHPLPSPPGIPPAERMKARITDLRLFRPLMLISKIKDLYHLIELPSSSTHTLDKEGWGGRGAFSFKAFFKVFEWERGWWGKHNHEEPLFS